MNKRLDVGAVLVANTPAVFQLFADADNPTYDAADGTLPTAAQVLSGFFLSATAAVKVDIGRCLANDSGFVAAYTVYLGAGQNTGDVTLPGGFTIDLPNADTGSKLAVQLTSVAGGQTNVAGAVSIHKAY